MLSTMITVKNSHWFAIILIAFLLFDSSYAYGQQEKEVNWRDRLYFGGNLGLAFGDITIIEVAPLVGYRITPRWSSGIGLKYEYYKTSRNVYGNFSTSIYGGSVFTEYNIWKDFITQGISLIAHCEYEALSLDQKYFEDPNLPHGRFILNSVLVGGGIRQHLGGRVSLNILILWNLNQTQYSPYENPTIRFNFNF